MFTLITCPTCHTPVVFDENNKPICAHTALGLTPEGWREYVKAETEKAEKTSKEREKC